MFTPALAEAEVNSSTCHRTLRQVGAALLLCPEQSSTQRDIRNPLEELAEVGTCTSGYESTTGQEDAASLYNAEALQFWLLRCCQVREFLSVVFWIAR